MLNRAFLKFALLTIAINYVYAKDYVNITNCPETFTNYFMTDTISIRPIWKNPKEKNMVYNYDWTYKIENKHNEVFPHEKWLKYMDNSTFKLEIPKYTLPPVSYLITVYSKRKANVKTGPETALESGRKVCKITRLGFRPIVIISGGKERTVPAKEDILVSGEESYNRNEKSRGRQFMIYTWTCTQKKQPPNFCIKNPISRESKFTIPAKLAREDEFTVNLQINFTYGAGRLDSKNTQVIKVIPNAVALQINCKKNCPPSSDFSNYKEATFLEASCLKNCEHIDNDHFEWSIEKDNSSLNFDYEQMTRFGRRGRKFLAKENAFDIGTYTIKAQLTSAASSYGHALINVNFIRPVDVSDCVINPGEGESLHTDFKFTCVQKRPNEQNFYELYARDADDITNEELLVSGFYPEVLDTSFKLPPSTGKIFFVKVISGNEPDLDLPVTVNVSSALINKRSDEVIDILDQLYHGRTPEESLKKLVQSPIREERDKALQVFQSVVDELVVSKIKDKEFAEFVTNLKYAAAEDMLHAPFELMKEVFQISDSLVKLQALNQSAETDPMLAKFTTSVCKKMLDRSLHIMKEESTPLQLGPTSQKLSNIMTKCLELHTKPNFEIMKPIPINVTTQAPSFFEPVITENYPNYEDHDEEYYQNLEYLKEASFNIINGSATMAKIMALTTATGEGLIKTFGKQSETVVLKEKGAVLSESKVTSQGVTMLPSKNFDFDHSYDLLMTTWKNDILWWNPSHTEVATNIVSCQFWHSTCKDQITELEHPASLFFNLKEDRNFTEETAEFYFRKFNNSVSYRMKVHRVFLPKLRILHVLIENMATGDSFNVALTKNRFPSSEDFMNSTIVESGEEFVFSLANNSNDTIICYVGVRLNTLLLVEDASYRISTTAKSCLGWTMVKSQWELSCTHGNEGNYTVIHCQCTHFSIYAGYVENVEAPLQEVIVPDLELQLLSSLVVFITLVLTYLIYVLLLLLNFFERKKDIYFLADNNLKHRFAYLITIRTGFGYNAGTSSNIVMKIIGEKKTTEPHVLNYPDPKLRILQTFGKDTLLLTTESHLGDLKEIEIWFDSIGPNPSWYCHYIKIYDMQQNIEWYFSVKKTLSVMKGITYFSVNPRKEQNLEEPVSNSLSSHKPFVNTLNYKLNLFRYRFRNVWRQFRMKVSQCRTKFRFELKYHTWNLWLKEKNFSYLKKLTVIFSTLLSTYSACLVFQGPPKLNLQDGIGSLHFQFEGFNVFVAFASSFVTFSLHCGIAWCFRFSDVPFPKWDERNKLPVWSTMICWALLVVLIVVSSSILVVYGFWLTYNNSLAWLTTTWMGVFIGIIFYEALFILCQNFCFEIRGNLARKIANICKSVEDQREYLYRQFGDFLLRPYFEHLYKPLDAKEIKARLLELQRRYSIVAEFEDLIMFGIYVFILYVVIYSDKDNLVVQGHIEMREVIKGQHTRTMNFEDIETVNGFYDYMNVTLIPSVQPHRWYGNYSIFEPGLMTDISNKYIGVVRLRQQRPKSDLCTVHELMRFLNLSCWPEFRSSYIQTKTSGYQWEKNFAYMSFDRLKDIWRYFSSSETGTLSSFGEIATYGGGGYVAYLGRTLYNSYANFAQFVKKRWIDQNTRAIFIEFLTYNANYNIFNSIFLLLERSATGFISKTLHISTARMLIVEEESSLVIIFPILFVVWIGMLFFKKSIGVIKQVRTFYKNFWLMTDLVIIIMSVLCVILYGVRTTLIGGYLEAMETAKKNEFLNYFYLFYIEDFLTFSAAFLVCIATVRLWKFLRFATMFRILERNLVLAAEPLLAFALVYLIMYLAFSFTFLLILGNEFENLSSFLKIVRTMMTTSFKATEMEFGSYMLYTAAVFYLVVYMVTITISLFIFVMIIVMAYAEAQMEFSSGADSYTIKDYVVERFFYLRKYVHYKTKRMRAGQLYSNKVTPKSDKFMYSNSFSLPTNIMLRMRYLTQCILRNMKARNKPLSDQDVKLMLNVCYQFFSKTTHDELDVFFKGREKGKKVKLVDEKQIEKISNVVDNILHEDRQDLVEEQEDNPMILDCVKMIRKNKTVLRKCELDLKLLLHKIYNVKL